MVIVLRRGRTPFNALSIFRATLRRQMEYKTEVLTHGFMGMHKGEINREKLEAALGALGRDGWELMWVLPDAKLDKEKDGHLLIFKRA
jgi:hypothetical protein